MYTSHVHVNVGKIDAQEILSWDIFKISHTKMKSYVTGSLRKKVC